ncbi:tRNA cytosine(32) 2-sulfurtransferase TtcA [Nitrospira tepida]|uniref:tRNA cytosine(32) 2-sulfurtransferase TtcA n=2 Tax=Nitrospira tepida TaxID=2973512 RepID=A0AA86N1R4_9BACT|nr:tRNA cytosine(32) 2-sulfurtransferase TtcA [Nitrospira tepida]
MPPMIESTNPQPRPSDRIAGLTGEARKLQTRLCRLTGQAIADYGMIDEGDTIMVCLSGGKDSYGLLDILLLLQSRAPISYNIVAVNLDQKQPGFPAHVLPEYLSKLGVPFRIETRDTYSTVKRVIPEGETMCSLCSRLRRAILYQVATELGATKIALGHHREDILETFVLNMLYNGALKTMPPKLGSDDGRHVVIRPLAYVPESDLAAYAEARRFPIIPCDLCGSQEHLKRKVVKSLLGTWEQESPGCLDSMLAALGNVAPSHLLDRALYDFQALEPERETGRPTEAIHPASLQSLKSSSR